MMFALIAFAIIFVALIVADNKTNHEHTGLFTLAGFAAMGLAWHMLN